MYKEKLLVLCKALEIKDPDSFIEAPEALIQSVGVEIATAAKLGRNLYIASQHANKADHSNRGGFKSVGAADILWEESFPKS